MRKVVTAMRFETLHTISVPSQSSACYCNETSGKSHLPSILFCTQCKLHRALEYALFLLLILTQIFAFTDKSVIAPVRVNRGWMFCSHRSTFHRHLGIIKSRVSHRIQQSTLAEVGYVRGTYTRNNVDEEHIVTQ